MTEVHFIREESPLGSWAFIVADDETGLFAAHSDFGSFTYVWPKRHRSEHLHKFLAGLSMDYFGQKTLGREARVYSAEKTEEHWKRALLQRRRECPRQLTKGQAREIWRILDDEVPWGDGPIAAYYHLTGACLQELVGDDYCDLTREEWNIDLVQFWQRLWPLFLAKLETHVPEAA